jgi:hypothetical protein
LSFSIHVGMAEILEKRWGVFGWGVFASVLLHVAVVSSFLVKLPEPIPTPEEETVSVEMVPPPEEKKPDEKKPEEQAALKIPEEKKPEEKQPEQPPAAEKPADEKKTEEKKAETKPPEPPKEEAKAEPPPPPPPAKPPEEKPPEEKPPEPPKPPEQKPPEPKPEEKKPEEKKAEEQPKPDPAEQAKADDQAAGKDGKPQPLQPMRPVFEFGDKNTGPKKAEDGDASKESGKPAGTPDALDPKPDDAASAGKPDVADTPPAKPVPDDINLPEVAVADAHAENNGPAAEALGVPTTAITQTKPKETAKADPTATAATSADPLTKAKKIYSQSDSGDSVARTAIDGMPRGVRVAELCTTELREQLKRAPQHYQPELLPSYRLSQGTVLDVKRGAFRASSRWYDMRFRCEVDADATKVVSFAYDVGDPVPRAQWRSRGFPDF